MNRTIKTTDRPFIREGFGAFLQDIVNATKHPELIKALGLTTDTGGGFLVGDHFSEEIRLVSNSYSIVRPRATVLPVDTDNRPIPTLYDKNHSVGNSPFSGIAMEWIPDGQGMTAIEPAIGQTRLIPERLGGYTYVSNRLLSDSELLPQVLMQVFGKAAAYYEDKAFIAGDGVAKPLGILNSGALIRVNRSASNVIAIADLAAMFARLMPGSHNSSRLTFIASPTALAQLIAIGPTALTFTDGAKLLGVPIFFTDSCPALGSVADLILADLYYYVIGQRLNFTMEASSEIRFTTDETAFWLYERVDGQPWIDTKFTPENGSSTLSPFVTLYSATTGGD
jgi:HK97 family phage major capsid protein